MLDKEIHIRFTPASVRRFFVSPFFWVPFVILVLFVPWGSEKAPAWVQAIGSIAAILVAVWVSHEERRKVDAIARERMLVLVGLFKSLAERAGLLAAKVYGDELPDHIVISQKRIERIIRIGHIISGQLGQIDVTELPDHSIADKYLKLCASLVEFNDYLAEIGSDTDGDLVHRGLKFFVEQVTHASDQSVKAIDAYLA